MADTPEPQNEVVEPVESGARETPTGPVSKPDRSGLYGGIAVAVLVICLALAVVNRIRSSEWGTTDWILVALSAVAAAAATIVWWPKLSSRSALLSFNAVISTLALLGILVLLNVIASRRLAFVKKDFTAGQFYSLSDQTAQVVRSLGEKDELELIAVVALSDQYGDPRLIQTQTKRLREYGRLSPKITVRVVDAELDPEARELYAQGALTTVPAVVVRRKDNPEVRESVPSLDEPQVTQALTKLLDPSSRKLYWLKGHGEIGLNDANQTGMAQYKKLVENDRYEFAELTLLTEEQVPADAAAVICAFPKAPVPDEEMKKLEAYLSPDRGGRMFLLLDPDSKTNLGGLTSKFGIDFHPEVVNDPQGTVAVGGDATIFGTQDMDTTHEVTKIFANRYMAIFLRAGRLTRGNAGEYELVDLIKSSSGSYTETKGAPPLKPESEATAEEQPTDRTYGAQTVAMTASTKDPTPPAEGEKDTEPKPDDDKRRIRLAVVADGDFATDSLAQFANVELAANLTAWLTDNSKVIGIRPKDPNDELEQRKITIDRRGKLIVFLTTLVAPMLVILGAGIAVQIVRR